MMENAYPQLKPTFNATPFTVIPFSLNSAFVSAGWSCVREVLERPDPSSRVVFPHSNLCTNSYTFCVMQSLPYCRLTTKKKGFISPCSTTVQFESGAAILKEDL
jgi:hypothetical protein